MRHRAALAGLLVLVLVASPGPAAHALVLSREHLQRVDRGEVVVLGTLPPGGRTTSGHGGTAIAMVNAAPAAVWQVLVDFAGHRGLYPRVADVEIIDR